MKKLLLSLSVAAILFLQSAPFIYASEGWFELRNTVGSTARCWADSILLPNLSYKIILSCRDIVYPGGAEIFNYSVWATKAKDGSSFYLGEVGVGKAEFATKEPFNSMFVTTERTARPRTPTGSVIMQGQLKQNTFLDGPGAATATTSTTDNNELAQASPLPSESPEPKEQKERSTVSRIIAAGGVIVFIVIFALVLVLFVITRK
jgi:hypothetical protein